MVCERERLRRVHLVFVPVAAVPGLVEEALVDAFQADREAVTSGMTGHFQLRGLPDWRTRRSNDP